MTATSFPAGFAFGQDTKPVAIAVGDFNRDGHMDVATADQGTDEVSILLGNGNGSFRPAYSYLLAAAPDAILAVDLTGNGILDLVTVNKAADTISVLMGNGNGTFQTPVPAVIGGFVVHVPPTYPAGSAPVALAYGDFNGDHHVDLAVADNGSDTVTILLGDGHGHFKPGGTVTVMASPTSVAVGDFNHDGYSDIATVGSQDLVNGQWEGLDINLNDGHGGFAPAVSYATNFISTSVVVGNFRSKSEIDLAVADSFPADKVSILLGNPDGTFQPFVKYDVGAQHPLALAVADLTGNGIQDIVTANDQFASNSVSVLMGNGDGTFGTVHVYTANENPVAIAVADFNGDGLPDVVTADEGTPVGSSTSMGVVTLLLGNGDGTLLAAPDLVLRGANDLVHGDFTGNGLQDLAVTASDPSYSGVAVFLNLGNGAFSAPIFTPSIFAANELAVGDFNGDHNLDLAVATNDGKVDILLGNGDGTFGSPTVYAAGSNPDWIAADDLTGNGHLDLVVGNGGGSTGSGGGVYVLMGNGDGTFATATSVAAGGPVSYVTAADLNGDHHDDLIVVNGSKNQVSVLDGNGDGTFGPPKSYATEVGPASVGVGDFTGDRRLDLAVPTFFGSGVSSEVSILLNGPTGIFRSGYRYPTDSRPQGIAVDDFNRDRRLDFAVANNFADNVWMDLGTGLGTFVPRGVYAVGDRPTWVTSADFTGDGYPDLAVLNSNSDTITLLETPLPTADHFRVQMTPATATAGSAFLVTVEAFDADNRLMPGYTGSVSLTSNDTAATLPAAYRFTAADHGVHRFRVWLRTAGSETITVHAGTATGSATVSVVATKANHLQVTAPTAATAGTPFDVTVTARDPFGNVATSYQGTVHFITTSPLASLPSDYTFQPSDNGQHTFAGVTSLNRAGVQYLIARDTVFLTIRGSALVTVSAAAQSQFFVGGIPLHALPNVAYTLTVIAQDAFGNTVTGYLGTVQFSNAGGTAALPNPYQFTTTDRGRHLFKVTLQTAGPNQSVTVDDENNTSDTGSETGITVS